MMDKDTGKSEISIQDGLLFAWLLDGKGGGRELGWDEITDCHLAKDEWIWIHFDYTKPRVQEWMYNESGLSELTAEALLQIETRPRCVSAEDGLMVFLRGVNLNPGANPEDMVSVRMWVNHQRVISLRMRQMMSIQSIRETVAKGNGPKSPADFLTDLVDRLLDRAGIVIEELYDSIDEMEDAILEDSRLEQREHLANIRRQSISLRRFLAPQREALNRLSSERSGILTELNRLHLREDFDRLTRFVEDLDAARERATVIHETLISQIAEQTNQRMFLLSVVAAIFLPLSFLTGLLGINVGGIPLAESSFGFIVVVILMSAIGVGLWFFFRLRRWF